MNMVKANGGFTLVELIVVIAILAILAGVSLPAYQGYIEKATDVRDQVAGHEDAVNEKANNIWQEAFGTSGNFGAESGDAGNNGGSNDGNTQE